MLPGIDRADDVRGVTRAIEQAGGAAQQSEQHALGQQLAHQPLPARAERGADGDFLLPAGGARQQQVGDVGAGDQQHERRRSPAAPAPRAARCRRPDSSSGTTSIVNVRSRLSLSRMRAAIAADVGVRLRHRHARLQPRHEVVVLVAAAVDGVGAERQRQEHVHLPNARDGRHDLGVQEELGSEHAGDRRTDSWTSPRRRRSRSSVMLLPTMLGSASKSPLPEAVAEDHDGRLAGHVIVRDEQPAVQRLRRRAGGRGWTRCAAPSTRSGRSQRRTSVPLRPWEIDISSNDRFSFWMSMYWPGDGQSCGMLIPGDRSHRIARRSGSGYGSGLSRSALTTLKIAVLAPMPIASEATITKVEAGAASSACEARSECPAAEPASVLPRLAGGLGRIMPQGVVGLKPPRRSWS